MTAGEVTTDVHRSEGFINLGRRNQYSRNQSKHNFSFVLIGTLGKQERIMLPTIGGWLANLKSPLNFIPASSLWPTQRSEIVKFSSTVCASYVQLTISCILCYYSHISCHASKNYSCVFTQVNQSSCIESTVSNSQCPSVPTSPH